MGGSTFITLAEGKTAEEAFRNAVEEAEYDYGHSGYTGTIAEKNRFIIIDVGDEDPENAADRLIDESDPRIDNKWGPAGAIKVKDKDQWVFFGWASS